MRGNSSMKRISVSVNRIIASLLVFAGVSCALLTDAPGGEKPAAKANPGEVKSRMVAMGRLSFVTPKQARRAHTKVTVSGGKGSLPISGLSLVSNRGLMAVIQDGDKNQRPLGVAVPPKGFSQAITAEVKFGDGKKGPVALSFAWTGKKGEYFVRNTMVAMAQYGDSTITVIDDNCNGSYSDVGEDAVIVGNGLMAAPLGSTVLLDGRPHGIQVSQSGQTMVLTPVKDFKQGVAMVSKREGHRLLIGAVLKGPSGGYHVIGDRGPMLLPIGNYTFLFASLGNPVAGQFALLEGKSLTLTVKEGNKVAFLKFGRPELKVSATYDPVKDRVDIAPPDGTAITCKAGSLTFFFAPGTPKLDIIYLGSRGPVTRSRDLRMPTDGNSRQPRTLHLSRKKYNLDRGKKYRFELRWPNGVVDEACGSATLEIPRISAVKKKKK